MSKFVTLGDVRIRPDQVAAYAWHDRDGEAGYQCLRIVIVGGARWDMHDETGELFTRLRRAVEAG